MPVLQVGDILANKYRIEGVLGTGGMAVVYAATQFKLERLVAIKVMRREILEVRGALSSFVAEALTATRIRSLHAAHILDVDSLEDNTPFIVMEHLKGQDLGQVLEARGPVATQEAAEWVLQACEAVAEAHSMGIVHRDLKPQNLFMTRGLDGRALIKVLDFGVASTAGGQRGASQELGTISGSPEYMSPEQAQGQVTDHRSDIWSLGVVLFELCTGGVPFGGNTLELLLTNVCMIEPDWTAIEAAPAPLQTIIRRCLCKSPQDRFQSVHELARALAPLAPRSAKTVLRTVKHLIAPDATVPPEPPTDTPTSEDRRSGGMLKWIVAAAAVTAAVFWFVVTQNPEAGAGDSTLAASSAVPTPEAIAEQAGSEQAGSGKTAAADVLATSNPVTQALATPSVSSAAVAPRPAPATASKHAGGAGGLTRSAARETYQRKPVRRRARQSASGPAKQEAPAPENNGEHSPKAAASSRSNTARKTSTPAAARAWDLESFGARD